MEGTEATHDREVEVWREWRAFVELMIEEVDSPDYEKLREEMIDEKILEGISERIGDDEPSFDSISNFKKLMRIYLERREKQHLTSNLPTPQLPHSG